MKLGNVHGSRFNPSFHTLLLSNLAVPIGVVPHHVARGKRAFTTTDAQQSMDGRGTHIPCEARVADGAIRGAFVGVLWAAFGPSETVVASAPKLSSGAWVASGLRYGALSTLSFSAFFGLYSGLLCWTERSLGRESLACPLVAGGAIGSTIGACLPPPRAPNVLVCGSVTAGVSMLSAYMLQKR